MSTAGAPTSTVRCPDCDKPIRVRAVPRGTPRCPFCKKPVPWIVNATEETFTAETTSSVPVLVDLWAPWCAPCRQVAPVLEQIARRYAGRVKVVKLNVDEAQRTSARLGVQSIPTLLLVRGSREADRVVGALPGPQLERWLAPHLTPA
jgi:thioredoxin 2